MKEITEDDAKALAAMARKYYLLMLGPESETYERVVTNGTPLCAYSDRNWSYSVTFEANNGDQLRPLVWPDEDFDILKPSYLKEDGTDARGTDTRPAVARS